MILIYTQFQQPFCFSAPVLIFPYRTKKTKHDNNTTIIHQTMGRQKWKLKGPAG